MQSIDDMQRFADLTDSLATTAEDFPVCPHCGYIHEGIDPSEWYKAGTFECEECEKPFVCVADFSVSFSTTKVKA